MKSYIFIFWKTVSITERVWLNLMPPFRKKTLKSVYLLERKTFYKMLRSRKDSRELCKVIRKICTVNDRDSSNTWKVIENRVVFFKCRVLRNGASIFFGCGKNPSNLTVVKCVGTLVRKQRTEISRY